MLVPIGVATLIGFIYALMAPPVYRSNAVVRVEGSDNNNASRPSSTNLPMLFENRSVSSAELEMLRTRAVVMKAVDSARLNISAEPKRFPLLGGWIARRSAGILDPGVFGWGGYAWGHESVELGAFDVPRSLEGQPFTLKTLGDGAYELTQGSKISLRGQIGVDLKGATPAGAILLRVDKLNANAGTDFKLSRISREEAAEALLKVLSVTERGKQSGVFSVSLDGEDPVQIASIVNAVARQYIQLNVDLRTDEAERSLTFLDSQLPQLRASIEAAEARYSAFRNSRGTADVGEEVKAVLQQSVATQVKLAELRQKRVDLATRFNNEHPMVEALNQQIRAASGDVVDLTEKLRRVPGTEQELARLTRDVRVNTELYASLLATAQQLRLARASRLGSAKLIDEAVASSTPVGPKRTLVLAGSMAAGVILSALLALARKGLTGAIANQQELARAVPVPLVAVVPHSRLQARLVLGGNKLGRVRLLAEDASEEGAVESLRTFRATLDHTARGARNNVILFVGPTPGVGKSFIAANFAALLARSGKRILLIDGDLREGALHRYFGRERDRGLGELMLDEAQPGETIARDVVPGLDFLSTGTLRLRSGDALAALSAGRLLSQISGAYDYVVVDTAPVLAVADALVLSSHAGQVFCVARKGRTTVEQLLETSSRFAQGGAPINGIIFNDAVPSDLSYGYGTHQRSGDPPTGSLTTRPGLLAATSG